MKIPNPYFKNVPEIGNLVMDYIILAYDYPLLYVCKEENGKQLYLCDCCDTYKEQRWLIAPTTASTLLDLLENRLTIRDAFKNAKGLCCVATWSNLNDKEEYELLSSGKEFDFYDLPAIGVFLDVEEEEYKDLKDYIIEKERANEQQPRRKRSGR